MELYEALRKRRTIREFQPKAVEPEKIKRVLQAGLMAPSHNHFREWEFILVNDFDRRRTIVEQGACAKDYSESEVEKAVSAMCDWERPPYLAALPVQKKMLMTAPQLLLVCFRMKKPLAECVTLYDLNNFASVWLCIENILLAMTAEGLVGVTFAPKDTAELKKLLGMPSDYEVAALIPIGYPKGQGVRQMPVSLREKTHHDNW